MNSFISVIRNNGSEFELKDVIFMYNPNKLLPDVTTQAHSTQASHLKWVGMEQIGLPVKILLSDDSVVSTSAKVDIFVSLDSNAKGIHMSRLYLLLNEQVANQTVTPEGLNKLLASALSSHTGISESAMVKVSFELPLAKKALLSDNYGHQSYPVTLIEQIVAGVRKTDIELTIPYSSTCPCSASLANQLNAESLDAHFSGDTVNKEDLMKWLTSKQTALATPHNQRSYAYVKLSYADNHPEHLDSLIFQLEKAIGTPVQTAVKREDEQAFARLNGANLLFCEDAARRLKQFLDTEGGITDYWFKIEHQESLHAHNAVVIDYK